MAEPATEADLLDYFEGNGQLRPLELCLSREEKKAEVGSLDK
jgi:hypothetical protein